MTRWLGLLCALLLLAAPAQGGRRKKKKVAPPPVVAPEPVAQPEPPPVDPPPVEEAKPVEPPPAKPAEAPKPPEPPPSGDLEKLRAEYNELRDALFRSRARAQTLDQSLFKTKLSASMRFLAGRRYQLRGAQVRIDDRPLWDMGERRLDEDRLVLGEIGMAPGVHTVTVRVDVRAKDNDRLGYQSEHSFALELPEGKKSRAEITIDESGDLPAYSPVVRVELKEAQ